MKWAAMTPFYACGFLILLVLVRKETRLTGKRIISMVDGVGELLVEVTGIILPLGLIISGLALPSLL